MGQNDRLGKKKRQRKISDPNARKKKKTSEDGLQPPKRAKTMKLLNSPFAKAETESKDTSCVKQSLQVKESGRKRKKKSEKKKWHRGKKVSQKKKELIKRKRLLQNDCTLGKRPTEAHPRTK